MQGMKEMMLNPIGRLQCGLLRFPEFLCLAWGVATISISRTMRFVPARLLNRVGQLLIFRLMARGFIRSRLLPTGSLSSSARTPS